jgi:hypothetical protein
MALKRDKLFALRIGEYALDVTTNVDDYSGGYPCQITADGVARVNGELQVTNHAQFIGILANSRTTDLKTGKVTFYIPPVILDLYSGDLGVYGGDQGVPTGEGKPYLTGGDPYVEGSQITIVHAAGADNGKWRVAATTEIVYGLVLALTGATANAPDSLTVLFNSRTYASA